MKLADVIAELVEERGLDQSVLGSIVCEGMLAAYEKKYPGMVLRVEEDTKTGELVVFVEKEVVSTVSDDDFEISLKKAKNINKDLEVGNRVWLPFDGKVGRIEVLRARQVIANKIKHIEALAVYNEFKGKQGEIVVGVTHKCERGGTSVKLGDIYAFLPNSLSIPGDKCIVGYSVKALLKDVLKEPQGDNQLILDRVSPLFLQKLFEMEIPEVFEKLVEIKAIVRAPGYKAKIAVASNDRNIDPVGTCVGVGGSRIKPILKELSGEKIDIFPWSSSLEVFVKNALKPAVVNRIEMSADNKIAHVWLNEDQRAFAIGKNGQNILLASQITGVNIQLIRQEEAQHLEVDEVPTKDEVYEDEF